MNTNENGIENINFSGLKALLVDMNEMTLEIFSEILTEYGMECEQATDGKKALKKIIDSAPGTYDIIFTSNFLPAFTGRQMTEAIRALDDPTKANMIIIGLASYLTEEIAEEYKSSGMNDVIGKPLDIYQLDRVLKKLL